MPRESSAARKTARRHTGSPSLNLNHELHAIEGNRVIVSTLNGAELCCRVQQVNETGAYLLRSGRPRLQEPLKAGTHVAVHILPTGVRGPNSIIVDASVVRVEDDGPGLAIRFTAAQEEYNHPYNDLSSDDWMTEVPERNGHSNLSPGKPQRMVAFSDFGIPNSAANSRPSPTLSLRRIVLCTLLATTASGALASFVLFGDWLGAIGL